jgi:recombination protein RecA
MSKFDLAKYKESIKASDVPFKKDSYIELNAALKEVTGLPGMPQGHVMQIYGPSNGGKSSLGFHLAAQAQKKGILPIFIITEGKINLDRLALMGVDENNMILTHSTYIEDVFKEVDKFMVDQANGSLPKDILFIVDSIGNTISRDSLKTNKDGTSELGGAMMKVSRVIRENMRVCSHRINDTRKVNSPHFASMVFINHSYKTPPSFPGGPTTDTPYGGDGIFYSSSLVIKVRKTKQLKAIKDKKDYSFAIVSKISVEKNHVNGVSNTGEFVIVPNDIIPNEKGAIDEYKEANKETWGSVELEEQD